MLKQRVFVGRFSDPADHVPVFGLYDERNYFQNNYGKIPEKSASDPIFQPGRFRYLIGGVVTPPYKMLSFSINPLLQWLGRYQASQGGTFFCREHILY